MSESCHKNVTHIHKFIQQTDNLRIYLTVLNGSVWSRHD